MKRLAGVGESRRVYPRSDRSLADFNWAFYSVLRSFRQQLITMVPFYFMSDRDSPWENGWESRRLAQTIETQSRLQQVHYAWGPSDCSNDGLKAVWLQHEDKDVWICCEVGGRITVTDDFGKYQGYERTGADQARWCQMIPGLMW